MIIGASRIPWVRANHPVMKYGLLRFVRLICAEYVLFPLSLKIRAPRWVALSLYWSLRPLGHSRLGRGIPLLILIPKLGGEEDFMAAIRAREEHPFNPVKLPGRLLSKLFRSFVASSSVNLLRNAYAEPTNQELRESIACENFMYAVLDFFGKLHPISAFVAANVSYVSQRELTRASQRHGIPFLLMHKESVKSPAQRGLFEEFYERHFGVFSGSAISVYNQEEKHSLERSLKVNPNSVVVTGCPRIDVLHHSREGGKEVGRKVVLFSIDERVGVLSPLDAFHERLWPNWAPMAQNVEAWFVSFAKQNPTADCIIKVKLGTEKQVEKRLSGKLPPNISVIFGGSGTNIVESAKVVVAFNSTVILESVARGVPVLVPDATTWFGVGVSNWLHDYENGVSKFSNEKAFHQLMAENLSSALDPKAELASSASKILRRYVGNDDGLASSRALAFLDQFARLE